MQKVALISFKDMHILLKMTYKEVSRVNLIDYKWKRENNRSKKRLMMV
jgi:hypothetical protein